MSEKVEYKKMSVSTEQLNANLASCNTHRNNRLIHITEEERATWNAKASTEEVKELAEGKASQTELNSHTGDSDIHISASERSAWNAKATTADVQEVDAKVDALEGDLETLETDVQELSESVETAKNQIILYTAPMQDGTVEGRYLMFAEYTFPVKSNYESADLVLLFRNRTVQETHEDGILRIRLRYGRSAAKFQYAQIFWLLNSGIDVSKFILCFNDALGKVQVYLDASSAYSGYIGKVLDMGISSNIVDFASWTLHNPTTGQAELPTEADGWATVVSE